MNPLYDTHAHLDFPDFESDLPQVVERAEAAGIKKVICVGTDLASSRRAVALAERFAGLYAAVGWHPNHVMDAPEDIRADLIELARHPKVVAIGETGLDFYRLPSHQPGGTTAQDEAFLRRQRDLFLQQLEVAEQAALNVIIHQRGDVLEETLDLLRPWVGKVRSVFHCFAGDAATVTRLREWNALVSFTGILTFKNGQNVRDALAAAPEDGFMLETDCPFLAPVPHRGHRCEPAYVQEMARVACEVRGCTMETLSRATCRTAETFFRGLA